MSSLPLVLVRTRQGVRQQTNRVLGRLRTAPYLRKWLALGILIGIVAGLGAILFYNALRLTSHYVLGDLGGYFPPTTAGEGGFHAASGFSRPWAIPLVVAGGALVAGLLVFAVAPEAEGHGTDAAIDAVHHNPRGMRPRVTIVKIIASALTIGSGGSGGREGPTAQISASFGSILSRSLNLSPADSRIAVSSGIASGIGAIFRAPLGGAILGAELLYRDDVEVEALLPSVVASIVAYAVYGAVEGFGPIFGYHTGYRFGHVSDLVWFVALGLATGALGRLYALVFYRAAGVFGRLSLPRSIRPALAGLAVGALGVAIPAVLGTGYGFVQVTLDRRTLLGQALWLVLLVPFAKILGTALSIGSGGSGGIFGPGMVIGAATGAALWRLAAGLPFVPHDPAPYVIVGMISCFGAVAHAPLAVMLMVAEMTGNLALLPPAMVALALATLVVGDTTIYRSQLKNRAESPAHRLTFGMPLASAVPLVEVMAVPKLVVAASQPAAEALEELRRMDLPGAPVVNASGRFIGSLHTPVLAERVEQGYEDTAGRAADAEAITVAADAHLDAALEALATSKGDWVPVLDETLGVVGIIGTSDLVRGYRLALRASIRRLGRAAKGAVLVEVTVAEDAAAAGRAVSALGLPAHTVIVAVLRQGNLLFADAATVICAGDTVSVFTRPGSVAALAELFGDHSPLQPDQSRAAADSLV